MRITIFPLSLTNDFEVSWDVDKNEFIVVVASRRLPVKKRPFKIAKTETSKDLNHYFGQLQNDLKPIGGMLDGATERFKNICSLQEFIETSGKSYRTDISFEDLTHWYEEQKAKTLASWADRKKAKTDEKKAAKKASKNDSKKESKKKGDRSKSEPKKKPLKNVVLKG